MTGVPDAASASNLQAVALLGVALGLHPDIMAAGFAGALLGLMDRPPLAWWRWPLELFGHTLMAAYLAPRMGEMMPALLAWVSGGNVPAPSGQGWALLSAALLGYTGWQVLPALRSRLVSIIKGGRA